LPEFLFVHNCIIAVTRSRDMGHDPWRLEQGDPHGAGRDDPGSGALIEGWRGASVVCSSREYLSALLSLLAEVHITRNRIQYRLDVVGGTPIHGTKPRLPQNRGAHNEAGILNLKRWRP
jgi:hypothetical protein